MRSRFSRRFPLVAALTLALAVALLVAAVAAAAPGDLPISTESPASGSTVQASDLGLKVAFSCPPYTKDIEDEGDKEEEKKGGSKEKSEEEEGEEEKGGEEEEKPGGEEAKKVPGDPDDYGVHFSTGQAIGPDGLLTTAGFDDEGEGLVDVAPDKVTCSAELDLPDEPISPDLYSGTIYWQAYRDCEACDPAEYEAGPVNSLVVTPNIEEPELNLEDHVYAGYPTKVSFSTFSDLTGGAVVLQRWDGKEWLQMDVAAGTEGGEAEFFVKLKKPAHTALRAVVTAPGVTDPLPPTKLNVRAPSAKRSVGDDDDGVYQVAKSERKTAGAHFKVTGGGRLLTGLVAQVPSTCTAGAASAPTLAKVAVKRARIAPDGTIIAEVHTTGATPAIVTLDGNLHDGVFSGDIRTAFLNCTGKRSFEADLGGVPKKAAASPKTSG